MLTCPNPQGSHSSHRAMSQPKQPREIRAIYFTVQHTAHPHTGLLCDYSQYQQPRGGSSLTQPLAACLTRSHAVPPRLEHPWDEPIEPNSTDISPSRPLRVGPTTRETFLDPSLLSVSPGLEVSDLCRNGGLCVDSGSSYFCHCPPGFQGRLCQGRVNPCESKPCQHGATCVAQPSGYVCQVRGLEGKR